MSHSPHAGDSDQAISAPQTRHADRSADLSGSVFLVEDSDEDYEAVKRALARVRPDLSLHRAAGGVEARAMLSASPPPALVLLDLNMPDGDGRELLAWLGTQGLLSGMPVVVLTTSTNPRDVERSYEAGASGYVFKPVDFALLEATIRGTVDYWVPLVD